MTSCALALANFLPTAPSPNVPRASRNPTKALPTISDYWSRRKRNSTSARAKPISPAGRSARTPTATWPSIKHSASTSATSVNHRSHDPRFRLEHCTQINDSLVARIRAIGAIPTPFSSYVYFHGEKMHFYGAERLKNMFAMRSFLDAGIRPTQASDYTASPFEPMMALQSQVTRTDTKGNVWGANQRISIEEAIR